MSVTLNNYFSLLSFQNSFPSMQPSFLELYEEIRDTILQSDNEEIVNLHKMPENRHHIERQFPTNTRPSDSSEDESPLPDDLSRLRNLKKGTAGCHSTAEDEQATPEVHGAPTGSSIRNRMSSPQQGASHRGRLPSLSSRTTPARPPQSHLLPSIGSESASVHTLPKMGVSSPRPALPLARVGDPLPPSNPSTWLTKGRGPLPPSSRTSSGMARDDAKPEVTSLPHTAPCCNPTRPLSHSATTSTAMTASGSDVAANRKHSLPLLEQYGRASTEAPPWLPNFPPKPVSCQTFSTFLYVYQIRSHDTSKASILTEPHRAAVPLIVRCFSIDHIHFFTVQVIRIGHISNIDRHNHVWVNKWQFF